MGLRPDHRSSTPETNAVERDLAMPSQRLPAYLGQKSPSMSTAVLVDYSEIISLPGPSRGNHITKTSDNADKFATLFSPATPHATPTSSPRLHPISRLPHPPPLSRHSELLDSPDSDLRSFVSVAPAHDPLSLMSTAASPVPLSTMTTPQINAQEPTRTIIPSSSMIFFDKFTEEAKRASERNKKGYLDELLLHEDDPLYWLKPSSLDVPGDGIDDHDKGISAVEGNKDAEGAELVIAEHEQDADRPLIDLSLDDLSIDGPSFEEESDEGFGHDSQSPTQANISGLILEPDRFRSSSLPPEKPPSAHSTAPPRPSSSLSTTSPSIAARPSQISESRPGPSSSAHHSPNQNYHTLSTFSSRWMSSLLSSSRLAAPSTSPDAHRTLDTLFATHPSPTPQLKTTHHAAAIHASPTMHTRPPINTSAVFIPRKHQVPSSAVSMSHGTPFASHMSSFIPPSGAPGFSGEDHSWDRGFSKDYDRERVERRSVSLKDRQEGEGCAGVLDVRLADLVSAVFSS